MKTLSDTSFFVIFGLCSAFLTLCAFSLGKNHQTQERSDITFSCTEHIQTMLRIDTEKRAAGEIPQKPNSGAYVGSKNGTKYYTPGCPGTKRIKPENYVWFSSADDAILQGYSPGSC